jgi:hypothetical protein
MEIMNVSEAKITNNKLKLGLMYVFQKNDMENKMGLLLQHL